MALKEKENDENHDRPESWERIPSDELPDPDLEEYPLPDPDSLTRISADEFYES